MAEIKSTLEKVMERVASMEATPSGEIDQEEKIKEGMRLGADYLGGREKAISPALARFPETERALVQKGIVQTLLRNIVLPRNGDLHDAEMAMQGLLDMRNDSRDLIAVISDMKQILDRYRQHKAQLYQQLENAFKQQLEQALAQQGVRGIGSANIDPSLHPKFQEEWQKIKENLNEQYGQALDQQKSLVIQLLSVS